MSGMHIFVTSPDEEALLGASNNDDPKSLSSSSESEGEDAPMKNKGVFFFSLTLLFFALVNKFPFRQFLTNAQIVVPFRLTEIQLRLCLHCAMNPLILFLAQRLES